MTDLILRIYDLLRHRPLVGWALFGVLTTGLLMALLTLSYKEDITDFLPLDKDNQTALAVYQEISGANKLYAIITARDSSAIDPDTLTAGVERFAEAVTELDSMHYVSSLTKTVDMERMASVTGNVYDAIPFYLTEADFRRIDSLLSSPGYVGARLLEDKRLLMFPASAMVGEAVTHDPLGLFSPVLGRLQQGGMPIRFEMYDGYILSPDGSRAIVMLESRFGAHESEHNATLVAMLARAAERVESESADLQVHVIGGPAIAVANAERIKSDSILAVCIAGVLIMALLIYVFRSVWNILLIIVSVGWGWLFAMGCIALCYDSVSIIVIGIASVILGIAVNYPLHLIDHLKDSPHPRSALREIVSPLLVGNVTTVGAFLCLVPLNSPALHDLGLFSSLLLVGTIVFVLIFLPHAIRIGRRNVPGDSDGHSGLIARIAAFNPESNRTVVIAVVALTCVFAFFSTRTRFDSDMRHINYMTPEQRDDLAYFQSLMSGDSVTESVYVVSNGSDMEQALRMNEAANAVIDSLEREGLARRHNAAAHFLHSQSHRERSLARWHELITRHRALLTDTLASEAVKAGFSKEAFVPFSQIISRDYDSRNDSLTEALASTVFAGSVSRDAAAGRHSVVQTLDVPTGAADSVKRRLEGNREFGGMAFDVRSMNGSIADTLSDDFNYIGIACGCIVFLFLWLSFGRIELAIVSFLPMAVSWVWILGIMGLTGITFNIVNVILATFIFGQGDDYTIFITEGLCYEFAYRRKLLASYKSSIIVSALIMFIGIGTLVFAKHPALRSLGEVTVVGMMSVVLMAWLVPPLIFNALVRQRNGRLRRTPLTLRSLLRVAAARLRITRQRDLPASEQLRDLVYGRYLYKGRDVERRAAHNLAELVKHFGQVEAIKPSAKGVITLHATPPEQGELALMVALMHPQARVECIVASPRLCDLIKGCARDFTPNLHVTLTEPRHNGGE